MLKETLKRLIIAGISLAITGEVLTANPEAVRSNYKEFIEVRKRLGGEEVEWQNELVILEQSVSLVESEIQQLKDTIEQLSESATAADEQRAELTAKVEEAQAISERYIDVISSYEERLKSLINFLPEKLQRDLSTLSSALPERGGSNRAYSQRLLVIASILNQVDKFNNEIKMVTELKTLDAGNIEVKTLYFGLGAALFSDAMGTYAGYGNPSPDGWKWTTVNLVDGIEIARTFAVYTNTAPPDFVDVKLVIE